MVILVFIMQKNVVGIFVETCASFYSLLNIQYSLLCTYRNLQSHFGALS